MRRLRWKPFGSAPLLAVCLVSGCGGGDTPSENPVPVLANIAPDSLTVGADDVVLSLTGHGFAGGGIARWNGVNLVTTINGPTSAKAIIGSGLMQHASTAAITMYNPGPGGGTSAPLPLVVIFGTAFLQSIEPSTVTAGGPSFTLIVRGSGFAPEAQVYLNNSLRLTSTTVSTSRIDAIVPSDVIADGTTVDVQVINPEGANPSGHLTLTVLYPAPILRSLSPTSATTDADTAIVIATGNGFLGATRAVVAGFEVFGGLIDSTHYRVPINHIRLQSEGVLDIAIRNPGPGGGTSGVIQFPVLGGAPSITQLSPSFAMVPRGSLTVSVTGSHFDPASVATWNGSQRPTTVTNLTSMSFTLTSADLKVAGVGQVAVTAPGGSSVPVVYPLIPASPAPTTQVTATQEFVRLHYDSVSRLVWGTTAQSAPTQAGRLLAVDPATGTIVRSVPVSGDPGPLALSDDGHYGYVGLRGRGAVARVDLPAGTFDVEYSLAPGGTDFAADLETLPGASHTVVVARRGPDPTTLLGIAVYDDGVRRTDDTDRFGDGVNRLRRAVTPGRFYGFADNHSLFPLVRVNVTAAGAQLDGVEYGLIGTYFADISAGGGFVYATSGEQVNPEKFVRVGTFPVTGAVCADTERGKVYFYSGGAIRIYHYLTRALIGTIPISPDQAVALLRFGSDGLAVLFADRVIFVRSGLIG